MKLWIITAVVWVAPITMTSARADVITFQTGLDAYNQVQDTSIGGGHDGDGASPALWAEAAEGSTVLVQFGNIFGLGAEQVPLGSQISSATLTLTRKGGAPNPTGVGQLARMLVPWDENSNATTFGGGVDFNNIEATFLSESPVSFAGVGIDQEVAINVTTSVALWSSGGANYGWALKSSQAELHTFASSEWTTPSSQSPGLTITYSAVPEPSGAMLGLPFWLCLLFRRRKDPELA